MSDYRNITIRSILCQSCGGRLTPSELKADLLRDPETALIAEKKYCCQLHHDDVWRKAVCYYLTTTTNRPILCQSCYGKLTPYDKQPEINFDSFVESIIQEVKKCTDNKNGTHYVTKNSLQLSGSTLDATTAPKREGDDE